MGSILISCSSPAGVRLVDCSGLRASRPVSPQLTQLLYSTQLLWFEGVRPVSSAHHSYSQARRGTAKGTRITNRNDLLCGEGEANEDLTRRLI